MIIQYTLEQFLEELRKLEKIFLEAQNKEILPLSFFSSAIDILNHLKMKVYEIEVGQLQVMLEHLRKSGNELYGINEIKEPKKFPELEAPKEKIPEEKMSEEKVLEEKIPEKEASEEKVPEKKIRKKKISEEKDPEEKVTPTGGILADTIGRRINSDFGKSLSLNDRFMFQRDLFQGNANEMDQAFAQLNVFQSLNEALEFLTENYVIPWTGDSGIAFKELLAKRFA